MPVNEMFEEQFHPTKDLDIFARGGFDHLYKQKCNEADAVEQENSEEEGEYLNEATENNDSDKQAYTENRISKLNEVTPLNQGDSRSTDELQSKSLSIKSERVPLQGASSSEDGQSKEALSQNYPTLNE
jgi:hypothetical protein